MSLWPQIERGASISFSVGAGISYSRSSTRKRYSREETLTHPTLVANSPAPTAHRCGAATARAATACKDCEQQMRCDHGKQHQQANTMTD
jgi:hypothetical protein